MGCTGVSEFEVVVLTEAHTGRGKERGERVQWGETKKKLGKLRRSVRKAESRDFWVVGCHDQRDKKAKGGKWGLCGH